MSNIRLNSELIIQTIDRLVHRIDDRFPESGLKALCLELLQLGKETESNIRWISQPNLWIRSISAFVILIGLGGLIYSISYVDLKIENTTFSNIVMLAEAIINDLVLLGASIYFMVTTEARIKRKRTLQALNQLRTVAHVIDMHQLTKDPYSSKSGYVNTEHSPKRLLTPFELQRYLDYCSEASALVAKIAALYAQSLPDEGIIKAVNEIEELTANLTRNIWEKIMILN